MRAARREAFTLVELLAAIAILTILASIALYFSPKTESRLANQGADQLQTYIASARARAMRDNQLSGIRLIADANGNFSEFQFIQAPEPFAPVNTSATFYNQLPSGMPTSTISATTTAAMSITGNFTASISAGDLLETVAGIDGQQSTGPTGSSAASGAQNNAVNRVTSVTLSGGNTLVGLASAPPFVPLWNTSSLQIQLSAVSSSANAGFRFIREPRPLMGETTLQLPQYVRVNGASSQNIPTSFQATADIIFAPSGQVVNASAGRIILWVDDSNGVSAPTLLCIYTRTGGVAAHPVNTDSTLGNAYYFTTDGKSSGQ